MRIETSGLRVALKLKVRVMSQKSGESLLGNGDNKLRNSFFILSCAHWHLCWSLVRAKPQRAWLVSAELSFACVYVHFSIVQACL